MARTVDVSDLVGFVEIAERLNLKDANLVRVWRRRWADFPEPVAKLRIGDIFYWPDIERWARVTEQRRYRAPPHPRR